MFSRALPARRVIAMAAPSSGYQLKRFKYNSHYWILKLVEDSKQRLRILDVGSADGYLGKILKERGHYVDGIERDPQLAERARLIYDRFYQADVDGFDFPERAEYDLIIFADVLEHLRDPAAVLRRCYGALKEDGKIIISVPNVANFVVRLSLLFGHFDYRDLGILDRTHLRFFTLRTLTRLLQDCGLKVDRVVATPIPVQLVWSVTDRHFFAPLHYCHFQLVRLWKTLLAYQFVVQADGSGRVPAEAGGPVRSEPMAAR
jgi:2-polyprenyl-3-methyl-5-hydroxy-6-metoxy-1,4-benzoquinol methylase